MIANTLSNFFLRDALSGDGGEGGLTGGIVIAVGARWMVVQGQKAFYFHMAPLEDNNQKKI